MTDTSHPRKQIIATVRDGSIEVRDAHALATFGVFCAWSLSGIFSLAAFIILAVADVTYSDSQWSILVFTPTSIAAGLSAALAIVGIALSRARYKESSVPLNSTGWIWAYVRMLPLPTLILGTLIFLLGLTI